MPTYDHQCFVCNRIFEWSAPIGTEIVKCVFCGNDAQRLFSPPRAKPICDIEPYWEENITQEPIYITSRKHKAEVLKEHGLKMLRGISDYR